ncbi:MAG TPA: hypothetical protein VFG63_05780 [Nocardioidaceae bacterium]|nr:hypothetical protein [Nocardioidaceae bacterium]
MIHTTRLGLAAAAISLGLVAGSAPAATALPDWRTTASSHTGHLVTVTDLRYATHPRFDRVVIDLRGRRPGYTIGYTRRLHREGSGDVVRLRGKRKMVLSLHPARAHDRAGDSVYTGPRKQAVHLPTLRGVAFLGDFEGYVTFGFGLDRRAPYRVFTLRSPRRLVIDFKH